MLFRSKIDEPVDAMNLAFASLCGDINRVNQEIELTESVSEEDIYRTAQEIFTENNSCTMYYHATQ